MQEFNLASKILEGLSKAKLNKDQQGGLPYQLDALYGNALQVFKALGEKSPKVNPEHLMEILRNWRDD